MLATSAMKGIGSTTVASVAKSPACSLFILRDWTVRHARCHTTQAHGVRPCGKNLTVSFFFPAFPRKASRMVYATWWVADSALKGRWLYAECKKPFLGPRPMAHLPVDNSSGY